MSCCWLAGQEHRRVEERGRDEGPRRNRQARLSRVADRGWDRLMDEHHVSFTVLVEAMGRRLADDLSWVPDEVIEEAKRIDRERHSRQRGR